MRLLNSRIVRLTLRRSAWMRWLPPINTPSPTPGDNPHRQVLTGYRKAGRDRRSSAVNRMQPIGFQVIRETARAPDAADEDHVLSPQPQFRQEVANRVEDDVVAAARAPADLLVAGEILRLLRLVGGGYTAGGGEAQICADHASHALIPAYFSTRYRPTWRTWPSCFRFRPASRPGRHL